MTARSSAEIREIIEECENQGFTELRAMADRRRAQLYKHESYRLELEAALSDQITTRIAKMSDQPSYAARQIVGILNSPFSFHVNGRNDARSDRQELLYAWYWATVFNPGNRLQNDTLRHQVVSPAALWWMDYVPFRLPANDEERETYRRNYRPFKLSVIDPMSASWTWDDNGQPTLACRDMEMSLVSIARAYGDNPDGDKNALEILDQQFPFLRGSKGVSADDSDIAGKKARVYIIDDGNSIGHYAEVDNVYRQVNNPTLEENARDIPNPWGRSSLHIIPGVYNDDAQSVEDRYRPLLDELLGEQNSVDKIMTHIASISFTPSKYGQRIPVEALEELLHGDTPIPAPVLGEKNVAALLGQIEEMNVRNDANVWNFLELQLRERDSVKPPQFLTNPDPTVLKDATATAQLQAHETSNTLFDDARGSIIRAIVDVCKAMRYFVREGHKPFREDIDESLYFTLTGSEKVTITRNKSVSARKGEEMVVTAADFEDEDTIEVTSVAVSDSQKMLRYQLKQLQVQDGAAPHEDLIAEITEDVTGAKHKLNVQSLVQELRAGFSSAVLAKALQIVQATTGEDLSPAFMGPEVPGQNGGSPPRPAGRQPANQMIAPATGSAQAGSSG